jgi:hypothetical protein
MKRLIARIERLEAKARPAEPRFEDHYDLSKLSDDELKFLVELVDICTERGDNEITAEQEREAQELLNKAHRNAQTHA